MKSFSFARGGIRALFFFAALSALAAAEPGDDERLRVEGRGVASGTGGAARAQAVALAENSILMDVVSQILPSRELPCSDQIQKNVSRYVQDSKLSSTDYVDDTTHVTVEALVDDRALKADVAQCLLPLFPEPPTVVLYCAEQTADGKTLLCEKSEAHKVLSESLSKAGLTVMSPNDFMTAYTDEQLQGFIRSDLEAAGNFARESKADTVLLVNAEAVFLPSSQVPGWLEINVKATLRAFSSTDGRLLDASTRDTEIHCQNPLAGLRQCVQDAVVKASAGFETTCILASASCVQTPGTILVLLENPGSRETAEAAGKVFSAVAGEGRVELLYASERMARYRVSYAGLLRSFSEAFAAADCAGKRVELTHAVDNRITGRFIEVKETK